MLEWNIKYEEFCFDILSDACKKVMPEKIMTEKNLLREAKSSVS
jgi:hypothetical protein